MKAVWKYPLAVEDEVEIEMPIGAVLLTVAVQGDTPQLWALVDPNAVTCIHSILTRGTGHSIDPSDVKGYGYIGTYQLLGGSLVLHVFDGGEHG